jgi:hypothetical protein
MLRSSAPEILPGFARTRKCMMRQETRNMADLIASRQSLGVEDILFGFWLCGF